MNISLKNIIGLLIFLYMLFFITACKKAPENIIPEVVFETPVYNQFITIPDTVKVSGYASDDVGVESIRVTLVNEDFIPVQQSKFYYPQSISMHLNFEILYPIYDFSLDSDIYYIQVSAFDDEDAKHKYQKVILNESAVLLEKIIVITRANSTASDVYELDLNLEKNYLFSVEGEFQSSDINSEDEQLYFLRNTPGKLQTYKLNTNQIDWIFDASIPYPTFCDVIYDEDRIYVSSENGDIFGLSVSGIIKFNTPVMTDTFPENIFRNKDFMIADLKIRTNNDRLLAVYYMASGSLKSTYLSLFDVVEFYSFGDNIIVFANQNGQAELMYFNVQENYFFHSLCLPEGELKAVEKVNNEFLMSIGGSIEKYIVSENTVVTYIENKQCNLIVNNPLNNELCFVHDNKIEIYDYLSGTSLQTISFDKQILDVHLLFNKNVRKH